MLTPQRVTLKLADNTSNQDLSFNQLSTTPETKRRIEETTLAGFRVSSLPSLHTNEHVKNDDATVTLPQVPLLKSSGTASKFVNSKNRHRQMSKLSLSKVASKSSLQSYKRDGLSAPERHDYLAHKSVPQDSVVDIQTFVAFQDLMTSLASKGKKPQYGPAKPMIRN